MSSSTDVANGRYKEGKVKGEEGVALTGAEASFSGSVGSSARGTTSTEAEDELHDGCIVLGRDAGRGNRYCTRYHIDRNKQREILSVEEVISRACCPCCLNEKRSSCGRTLWQFIRAEAFLISLHLSVVILGALKEALDLREVAEDIHLVHSIIETLVTVLILVVRHVSAWHAFKDLKKLRHRVEHIDMDGGVKTRSKVLKKLLKGYSVVSVAMVLVAVVCFFLFLTLAHLGWTILSNNFALIVAMACDALLRDRLSSEANLVSQDHIKAVTYEMSLLLDEATTAAEGPLRQRVNARVEKFQRAFRDTKLFDQPDYIYIPDGYKPQYDQLNMLSTMQVVSIV